VTADISYQLKTFRLAVGTMRDLQKLRLKARHDLLRLKDAEDLVDRMLSDMARAQQTDG
jgi:hypothetical protein